MQKTAMKQNPSHEPTAQKETTELPPAPKRISKNDSELITALFDLLADIKEKRPIKSE